MTLLNATDVQRSIAGKQRRLQNLEVNITEINLAFKVTITRLKATNSIR